MCITSTETSPYSWGSLETANHWTLRMYKGDDDDDDDGDDDDDDE